MNTTERVRHLTALYLHNWKFRGSGEIGSMPSAASKLRNINMLMQLVTKDREEKLRVLSTLLGREISSTKEIVLAEAESILRLSGFAWNSEDGTRADVGFIAHLVNLKDGVDV
jgi:hypothetical protein